MVASCNTGSQRPEHQWSFICGSVHPEWTDKPIVQSRIRNKALVYGYVVNADTGMVSAGPRKAEYQAGYGAGKAAAYLDLPGYAQGKVSGEFAVGFEDGYDAHWERADKIRAAMGCEESHLYQT